MWFTMHILSENFLWRSVDDMNVRSSQKMRRCCNFQKSARERLVESIGLRLVQPPQTACYGNEHHLLTCPHQRDHPLS